MFVNFLLPYSWGRGKRQVRDISCMRFFFFWNRTRSPSLDDWAPTSATKYKGCHRL